MKYFALLCVVAAVSALTQDLYATQFHDWKSKFNRTYASTVEMNLRFEIFKDNVDKIAKHNADSTQTWKMALNQFADMTHHEFASKMNGYVPGLDSTATVHVHDGQPLAGDVNWVTQGAVTNVKNQGQCGSCWAFSTCAGVEGAVKVAGGPLASLAPQELVDCDRGINQGCNGGNMGLAQDWVASHGLCSWNDYPYTARDGTCQRTCKAVAHISGHSKVGKTQSDLQSALGKQPVIVGVDAEPWQFYSGGIFSKACGTQLDHGVLAAGYSSEYWLVKNSWGTSWGESGYIRLAMGNECGVLNEATFPHGKA